MILQLSYTIPYFIQLICRNCGLFAASTGRGILGFPEVETVLAAMTGEIDGAFEYNIECITPSVFMNNMLMQSDPPEYSAVISTICHLTSTASSPRLITYPEIQALWNSHKVRYFQARLASAIQELLDREVLVEGDDEGVPAYKISVDLFRRWWMNEHRNISLELDSIKQEA